MFNINAMMAFGFFVFMRKTVPFQQVGRELRFRQANNAVIGKLPLTQFLGKESETVEISATLMPEITGAEMSILTLEQMAESGKPYPLIDGATFAVLGWFVVESVRTTSSEFFADGSPRKIDFSLSLKRTDESLLKNMLGDATNSLANGVNSALGGAVSAVAGGIGAVVGQATSAIGGAIDGVIDEATGVIGDTVQAVADKIGILPQVGDDGIPVYDESDLGIHEVQDGTV